jgi:Txe/YoeB family toxin of Txe-Axe toxin-antitoxin module
MRDEVRYAVGLDSTVDKLMAIAREEGRAELRARVAKLEAALKEIIHREPWKGRKDYEPGDAGLADYWSDMAKEFQEIARAALSEPISSP